ncbi:homeobox protein HOX1A-like isoform X2 [Magnolia sinica]|uniref:homeobox protein HOX1A-like isoform X2 n=1 Tax=Magnolia sinica TaxID=86752 RepID=UPI0026595C4B|nr:homeobox protein HOX1A-like isoform X2 [Magnolia sinica]
MDVTSPAQESFQAENGLSPNQNSTQQKHWNDSEHVRGGFIEKLLAESGSLNIGQLQQSHQDAKNSECNLGSKEMQQATTDKSSRSTCKENASSKLGSRKYTSSTVSLHPCTGSSNKRERGKEAKRGASENEFSKIRKRCGYLSTRMSFEKSLIDAYSSEGWKGQSQDKVKPEKELQRATSEILRCKLQMRDLFQHLDSLCAEGKLESLFDSEGQIYSEDIFCAKCGSKDSSANNDIILCDGICNRGFHQMCLVPPLLNEDIPPGDESWLCPGCVCKVACIDLLNNKQGTKLSINDKWEKVFPEAATTAAGDKLFDELPSDDSADDDYDPDGPALDDKDQEEGSSSDESDFTSASDDSAASTSKEQHKHTGLSSDDSEDNNYDPNVPDTDEKVQKEGSSSDASDFTSDSEDLTVLRADDGSSGLDGSVMGSGQGRSKVAIKENQSVNSELLSPSEPDLRGENDVRVSGKRHRQRLDYKKLHDAGIPSHDIYGSSLGREPLCFIYVGSTSGKDGKKEEYGNAPSDSSDDEDWNEMNTPKKGKSDDTSVEGTVMSLKNNGQTAQNGMDYKIPQSINDMSQRPNLDQLGEARGTSNRRSRQKMKYNAANLSVANPHEDSGKPDYTGRKASTSGHRRIGQAATQRLNEFLSLNHYPTREMKEDLSKELGMTVQQYHLLVWFSEDGPSAHQIDTLTHQAMQLFGPIRLH